MVGGLKMIYISLTGFTFIPYWLLSDLKGYYESWQKVDCINFIVPIGGSEEAHEDLLKMLQRAENLLSNM